VDFAGSGVVHLTGGIVSLVAIIILGPRKGRFYDEDDRPLPEPAYWPPHSTSLQMIGTLILWFGWYGFNPGSTLRITPGGYGDIAALACVNTTLSAAVGAIFGMFFDTLLGYFKTRQVHWDVGVCMNSALCALASITGGCAVVDTWAAVVIGIIAGPVYVLASKLLLILRIDDVVDAVPVHLFGGMWGLISTGLLAERHRLTRAYSISAYQGLVYMNESGEYSGILILNQLLLILWILAFAGISMSFFFYGLKLFGLLRVSPIVEDLGIDISVHKGSAYNN
jgi:Amt family ammonium transporter